MRLLIFAAALAVVFSLGMSVGERLPYPAAEHDAELGARIEYLERSVAQMQSMLEEPTAFTNELQCVHRIYEDGSAVHLDAEVAHACLRREFGWP